MSLTKKNNRWTLQCFHQSYKIRYSQTTKNYVTASVFPVPALTAGRKMRPRSFWDRGCSLCSWVQMSLPSGLSRTGSGGIMLLISLPVQQDIEGTQLLHHGMGPRLFRLQINLRQADERDATMGLPWKNYSYILRGNKKRWVRAMRRTRYSNLDFIQIQKVLSGRYSQDLCFTESFSAAYDSMQ
jgi:hypothetical protein